MARRGLLFRTASDNPMTEESDQKNSLATLKALAGSGMGSVLAAAFMLLWNAYTDLTDLVERSNVLLQQNQALIQGLVERGRMIDRMKGEQK